MLKKALWSEMHNFRVSFKQLDVKRRKEHRTAVQMLRGVTTNQANVTFCKIRNLASQEEAVGADNLSCILCALCTIGI
jgi:hypothetical protein